MSIKEQIQKKLMEAFEPTHLEVVNESFKHNVPEGSESHFKVLIVSARFEGESRINRQRQVNEVLATELSGAIHALAQKAMTPAEWTATDQFESPDCKGGSKA